MQDVNPAMAVLMKFSFDEEDRHVTFTLGKAVRKFVGEG